MKHKIFAIVILVVLVSVAQGSLATGINGLDGNLFVARPKDERLGFVGEVTEINPRLIRSLLGDGYVPVVAPLARGTDGQTYNLNADTAAAALATALESRKLVYLTDVEGLYRDLGDEDSLVSRATVPELEELMASGGVSAGMLPKLQSAVDAIAAGVERVHILDGRIQHSVLLEIFTAEGIGTMITATPSSTARFTSGAAAFSSCVDRMMASTSWVITSWIIPI